VAATRADNPDLLRAALGGAGSAGLIFIQAVVPKLDVPRCSAQSQKRRRRIVPSSDADLGVASICDMPDALRPGFAMESRAVVIPNRSPVCRGKEKLPSDRGTQPLILAPWPPTIVRIRTLASSTPHEIWTHILKCTPPDVSGK
jgi:hypothetical protein